MGEEVQLETSPQDRVFEFSNRPLPGSACVGDEDIDSTKASAHRVECVTNGPRVGDVTFDGQRTAAKIRDNGFGRIEIAIHHSYGRAVCGKQPTRRRADRTAAAAN